MAVGNELWANWLERLYNLRRDKSGSHERPHKPALLLSIIDLLDRGEITRNEIPLSDKLIETFKRYFAVVRRQNDQATIQNPFFYLSGDQFWRLVPKAGEGIYQAGATSGAPSVAALRRRVQGGEFNSGLWRLLSDPLARHQLREGLIARYFPQDRDRLAALIATNPVAQPSATLREEMPPGRDGAFRRTILVIYDFRCAACGVQITLENKTVSLVEAAHLIPFSLSRNDQPTNGIALCPNHHWAMDRHLIAPVPDRSKRSGIWRVNENRLDNRIEGQRDLMAIAGKSVILPGEEKFYPSLESLRWREQHLVTTY